MCVCVVVPLCVLSPVLWLNSDRFLGKDGGEWLELVILLWAAPSKMEI